MRTEINEALKTAMREKDARRISTLRLILAAIKEKDIAARAEDRCDGASDEDILAILQKMVKQREESARTYEEAGRLDLAEQEREEIEIIRTFLPRQFSDAETEAACAKVLEEVDATGLKDMGKCMAALKERYPGQMDFGKASVIIKGLLTEEKAS